MTDVDRAMQGLANPSAPAPPAASSPSLKPTTTEQQDKTTAGQRRVNLIWEGTQAVIALSVVISNMVVGVAMALRETKGEFPMVLSSSLFLIVGFYFSRTNHQAIGGVGAQPSQKYEGR